MVGINNMKKIQIIDGGRKFKIDVEELGFFGRFSGLMFSRRESANVLLFDFKNNVNTPIHSLFVFYPFVALWLDEKNNVIEKMVVYPWNLKVSPSVGFRRLVEIPISLRYKKIIDFVVGEKGLKRNLL
jgi:uncharacterized membrane protein (UPF0127 family)